MDRPPAPIPAPAGRPRQPLPIRIAHWLNVVLLWLMAASGLQILMAFPFLGPQGALYRWHPLQGWLPPSWMRVGDWLAGGRHWHFGLAWLLVLNALGYVGYLAFSGEWRRRLFLPRRDGAAALQMLAWYVRLRKSPPAQGLYNGLQRFAYTGVMVLALVQVLTGLALYKPVQLGWLAAVFGGYDPARAIHFYGLAALALFTVGHVAMVLLHPKTLGDMLGGGKR